MRLRRLTGLSQRLLLLLLIVAIISACSSITIEHSKMPASEAPSSPCRVVQHVMGEACIPNNPKRIIVISYEILGQALSLGVKPIGSAAVLEELNAPYLSNQSYLGNRVEGIGNIGQLVSPNLEKILQLKPDLILAGEIVEGTYPLLAKIAPTVVISHGNLLANWKEGLSIIAEILGKEAEAQQVLNHYNQRIEELKTALGDRYQDKTVSIAFPYDQNVNIYVKNSLPGSILEDLGLQRPPAQDISVPWGEVFNISEERLELVDGDILFFGVDDLGKREAYESLKQKLLWTKLNAVQKGQVYLFDYLSWAGNSALAADVVLDDLYKYLVDTP